MRFYKADAGSPGGFKRLQTKTAATALKWGYVPSVTTILGVIRAEYVEKFIIRNSLDHYREYGDYRAALAHRDTEAADFGTTCHALLEARLKNAPCTIEHDESHLKACEPLWQWLEANVREILFCEQRFADNQLGYGGTADLLVLMKDGRQMLLDLKTKKHSKNYPMGPDAGCHYQLSAYSRHFEREYGSMEMGNLFISSPFGWLAEPRLLFVDYGKADFFAGFRAAHRLWTEQHLGISTIADPRVQDAALKRFVWQPGEIEIIRPERGV